MDNGGQYSGTSSGTQAYYREPEIQELEPDQHIGTSIEVPVPLRLNMPDTEEPQEQAQRPEPSSLTSRDTSIFYLIACILGLLITYEATITGGVIIGAKFTVKFFPVFIRANAARLEDNYCAYLTPDYRLFGCIFQLIAFITVICTIFVRLKLKKWSFKKLLFVGSAVHIIGCVLMGVWGDKRFMLFIARVVQAVGCGILMQAADLLVHILPDEIKEKTESVFLNSLLVGPTAANLINMSLGLEGAASAGRIAFTVSGCLSLLLVLASIKLDGNAGKTIAQTDIRRAWLLLRKRDHRPQLVVAVIRTIVIPITDLNLYGTVLLLYFVASLKTAFIVPAVLGASDAVAKRISSNWLDRRRSFMITLSSWAASVILLIIGLFLEFFLHGDREKLLSRGEGIATLALVSLYWISRAIFSHSSGWLRHGNNSEVAIALSAITQALDALIQFCVALLTSYTICLFGGRIFFLMGILLCVVASFITIGVPDTAQDTTEEEERLLITNFRLWKLI